MACKPETEAQRLERITTQLLAALSGNANPHLCCVKDEQAVSLSIRRAKELIKQLDALVIAE